MNLSPLALAVANHLWQSTVVAALISLLVLVFRKNQARIRYWLWMSASLKFLIPFSLFVILGGWLRPATPVTMTDTVVPVVFEQITQPFSTVISSSGSQTLAAKEMPAHDRQRTNWPAMLLGIWCSGSVFVSLSWWRGWYAIRKAIRTGTPMAPIAGVPVLAVSSLLEPGVFGILRPVLLLPKGISERLTPTQLRAILMHEMCHIQRRDNLTAALHMLVEALFWFHPAVWWLRARLIEEREHACDEGVLASGNEAHTYAEGILNVCKLYFESPLACASGVTGADLKKRIVRIVTQQAARKLDVRRKLLLSTLALLVLAVPVVFGLAQAPAANNPQDLSGTWQGTLQVPNRELRTVLKISRTTDGTGWKATFQSIDQGGPAMNVSAFTFQGSVVKFAITFIDGSYEGKMSADGGAIEGTWTQGKPLPLVLKRVTPATEWTLPTPPPRLAPMKADYSPVFEVATIKPSKPDAQGRGFGIRPRHFNTFNTSISSLVTFSYGLHAKQIVGGPSWLETEKFDLDGQPDGEGQPSERQWKNMLQKLLAERCKLTFHREKREMAAYLLTVGKSGPKLAKNEDNPNGLPGLGLRGPGVITVMNATMADFAGLMQGAVLDRPVVDQTGLQGRFDFALKFTPDESQYPDMPMKAPPPPDPANAPPGLFTAIQEQLGLKLESAKTPVDILVIDHVEKPSEN